MQGSTLNLAVCILGGYTPKDFRIHGYHWAGNATAA